MRKLLGRLLACFVATTRDICDKSGEMPLKFVALGLIVDVDDLETSVEGNPGAVGKFHVGAPVVFLYFLDDILWIMLFNISVDVLGDEEGRNSGRETLYASPLPVGIEHDFVAVAEIDVVILKHEPVGHGQGD